MIDCTDEQLLRWIKELQVGRTLDVQVQGTQLTIMHTATYNALEDRALGLTPGRRDEETTLIAQRLIAFFTADDYRFRPFDRGYYAMVDGWKHDIGSDQHPGTEDLRHEAEALTTAEWEAIIDALTNDYRAGLLQGMRDSRWAPDSGKIAAGGKL